MWNVASLHQNTSYISFLLHMMLGKLHIYASYNIFVNITESITKTKKNITYKSATKAESEMY